MGHTTAISDDIKSRIPALQILIQLYFHIIEFYFHTIQQGIIVCGTRCNLIERIDHLHDTV